MSYTYLTERERYVISHLYMAKVSLREIGRRLLRSHTSIVREIKRNTAMHGVYWYTYTHQEALKRRQTPRHKKVQNNTRLIRYITHHLYQKWSPEQIANRLTIEYPEDEMMRVNTETIYRWIYQQAPVDNTLCLCLRTGRRQRKKHRKNTNGHGVIKHRTSITERPACVALRERYGDWEGDTIIGQQGTGAIVTHVERKSLYLIAGKLVSKHAQPLTKKTVRLFRKVPLKLRQTLTVDNGTEFADFKAIETGSRLKVYFAEPYSSWQRGCNENMNGLLRQYFPKGSDFRKIKDEDVDKAVKALNNRPRKSLNYQTPNEVMRFAKRWCT